MEYGKEYYETTAISKIGDYADYCLRNISGIYTPKKGEKVLDVGCGWGTVSLWLQKRDFKVVSIDSSPESIKYCRKMAAREGINPKSFVLKDGKDTGFEAESFDAVYLPDVLEHVYRDDCLKIIEEAYRVLKPDGKLVIYTPNKQHFLEFMKKRNIILKNDPSHIDFKDMAFLKNSLKQKGFSINKAYYIESHIPALSKIEHLLIPLIPPFRRRIAILATKQNERTKSPKKMRIGYIVTKYVADKRISLILKELAKLPKEKTRILDVGCGNMYVTDAISRKGYNIIGIDKEAPGGKKWMTKDNYTVMDATKMEFKDSSFDAVIALEITEHCNCIPEIKRVLKPEGIFICSTPAPGTDWLRKVLISLKLLENQDFEGHNNIVDLKKVPMKLLKYKKMFLGTSQFGVFQKTD